MASAGQAAAVAVDACKEDRESEGDRAEEKQRVRRRKEEEPSRTATASPALSCDGGGSRRRRHRARGKERGSQWSERERETGAREKEAHDRDERDLRHHRWCGRSRSHHRRRLKRVSVAAIAIGDEPICSLAGGGIVVIALAQLCIVTVAVWLLLRFPIITGAAGEPLWLLPRKRNECRVSFLFFKQDGENPAEEAKESNHGRLLACIASRPDQCGRDDGYILEGELEFYMKKIQKGKGAVFILILVYWMGWNRSYNDFSYLHVIF
ncbi:hypothetical protein Ahy_B05g076145 [Arachis hypogaea]|uniref:Uncharacterized protein n=1 Tax=Arachis hypogaea TaxID=3818 RepID=A0A444Z2P7_ARAHY|nr:hypothetical protein Ahy_B05g076145 [Arachis hypogaea]